MAKIRAFALLAAVALSAAGCSAFFQFNAFSSLEKPAVPDASRYQGLSGLTNLQADLASKSVVNALKDDYALSQQILTNLTTDPNYPLGGTGAGWSPAQQTAAILYSSLALQCTSGDVLVNNIVSTVMTNPSGNLQSLLQSIIPADVMADQTGTSFSNMVKGLLQAYAMYGKLGTSLVDINSDGKIGPDDAPPGMNMGDAAQKAAVALMMYTIDQAVQAQPPGFPPPSDVSQMWALVNNQANSISGISVPDPYSPLPPWLKNIFDAAGAPYPA